MSPLRAPAHRPTTKHLVIVTTLIWFTTLAIFVQAVIAGQFVSQDGRDGWITVHGVVADLSWVLALVTAAYAALTLRSQFPSLVRWSAALFAVTLAQTGIGHLITDKGMDWLIAVHVPLAFAVFAVAGYLSVWAVRARRQAAAGPGGTAVQGVPAADVTDVVRA